MACSRRTPQQPFLPYPDVPSDLAPAPFGRALLAKARENEAASSYPRVWMKSAVVERELGDAAQERALLEVGEGPRGQWALCVN